MQQMKRKGITFSKDKAAEQAAGASSKAAKQDAEHAASLSHWLPKHAPTSAAEKKQVSRVR